MIFGKLYRKTFISFSFITIALTFGIIFLLAGSGFAQSRAVVIADSAIIRGTPSEQGKSVEIVRRNEEIEVLQQRGAWLLIQTPEFVGWISGNAVAIKPLLTANTTNTTNTTNNSRTVRQTTTNRTKVTASRNYIRGPRGGCYYLSGSGKKVYVDRGLCN